MKQSLCAPKEKKKKTTINIQYQYSFGRSVKARTVQYTINERRSAKGQSLIFPSCIMF